MNLKESSLEISKDIREHILQIDNFKYLEIKKIINLKQFSYIVDIIIIVFVIITLNIIQY